MAGVRLPNMAWLRMCKSRVSHRGFAVVQVVLCDCESQWQRSVPVPRPPSPDKSAANPLLYTFMHTIVAAVRSDTTDLTARQLAVFLKAYLEPQTEHTVRGLAAELNVSKPAVTRALDRLAESDFIKREQDTHDRRSIIVRRTSAGSVYLRTLNGYVNDANKQAAKQVAI
jgi:DNA-binding MarR family transcriptional regulator